LRADKTILVFRKDWREISRNWEVILPIVIVPLLFSILFPILVTMAPSLASMPESSLSNIKAMIRILPGPMKDDLIGMTNEQTIIYILAIYIFAPTFLIIPIMASSVIASDSFAGEKERKTIEALFATPISDSELFMGKIMVCFIPAMTITLTSFMVYSTIIDVLSFSVFGGKLLFPNLIWILLIFGLAPAVALGSIGLTVMISAKVRGFREAQQISAMLLIPIMILILGQASVATMLGPIVIGGLVCVFAIVDSVIFHFAMGTFRREEILEKIA